MTETLIRITNENEDGDELQRAVKKFSIFWKITDSLDSNYRPFLPFHERVGVKKGNTRSYAALHQMLEILSDDDPTLRLSCRSWLSESKMAYSRILDPLLSKFMEETDLFQSQSGQLFFLGDYNAGHVIDDFNKLRDIILNLNTQDEFLNYIVTQDTSRFVKPKFEKQKLA